MTEFKQGDVEVAVQIIRKAEADLGPLSAGQRSDLLADNRPAWPLDYIQHVLADAAPLLSAKPRIFTVQMRGPSRKWKACERSAQHSDLRSALERILICDPDRFFDPNMRVVDEAGAVVLDLAIWRECMAAGRSLPEGY